MVRRVPHVHLIPSDTIGITPVSHLTSILVSHLSITPVLRQYRILMGSLAATLILTRTLMERRSLVPRQPSGLGLQPCTASPIASLTMHLKSTELPGQQRHTRIVRFMPLYFHMVRRVPHVHLIPSGPIHKSPRGDSNATSYIATYMRPS